MAATVQLTIQTNEPQVRAQLASIQQQLNQMTSRQYNIQINAQLNQQLISQLSSINALLGDIRANQQISLYVNAANAQQTITQLRGVDTSIRGVQQAANGTTQAVVTLDTNLQQFNQNQQRLRNNTDALTGSLRMLRNVLVTEVRQAFSSALTEMKAVDTELITIQKVTGESAEGMKRYADDAYEVASRMGAAASEYLNAVGEFAKAGYLEKSKELGELAIMTAKVGDTTQQTANQFLLSVDAAYRYEGSIEKLTAVLDGANEIGNRFPTSVDKIAQGLGKVSPIAAQAHVGIDELTAAIGTITAVTQRSGTEAATALRALFLNIMGDTKTEIEDGAKWTAGEIEGLRDLLKEYAPEVVKAADATKTLINPMEAIAALSRAMDDGFLTEQKLMSMVSDIGGKLRSSQLLALIQNFDKYNAMLKTYRESAGSAAEEFSIWMDSWAAKTNQLKDVWTDFVQRQLGTDKIKDLLDKLIKIVENLDNWIPLIKGIGLAIVALNIPGLIMRLSTLFTMMGGVPGILAAILSAIGLVNSAVKQHAADLEKAAKTSLDNAKKEQEEVKAMQELAAQYMTAKEGSDEFKSASEKMRTALGLEADAVENLTEKYKENMIAKAQAAAIEATTAFSKAGPALEAAYSANMRKVAVPSLTAKDRSNSFLSSVAARLEASGAVFGGGDASGSSEYYLSPTNTSAAGISAYYEAIATAMREIEAENYRLVSAGQNSALLQSNYYKGLSNAVDILGESYSTYAEARDTATEAERNASGVAKFYSAMDTIRGGKLTQAQFGVYIKQLQNSKELSESQKEILISMAQTVYPEYAKAIGLVSDSLEKQAEAAKDAAEASKEATSALAKFQEATKKGSEKDDPFKSYKEAYDTVMKEARKGRYGSNAFQYGIRALLDPQVIEEFKGDWSGLVKEMQKSLGGLYADADSMGTGLLDKIAKAGEKVSKTLYQIRDENGNLLASFDKKSGAFQITQDPEGIKILASKVGMSAESLIAGAMALGAIDPNADLTGLNEALKSIITGAKEEDPTVTAMNTAAEAQNNSADAQKVAAEAEQSAADAMLAVAQKLGYGGERGEGAGEANGGAPEGGPSSSSDETESGPSAHTESSHISKKKSIIETYIDRVLGGGGAASSGAAIPVVISNKDSQAYHSRVRPEYTGGTTTDAWGDIDMRLAAMGQGAAGAAVHGSRNIFGVLYDSIFGKRASSSSGSESKEVSEAVAEGVEQGIVHSNKDSAAYHSGVRGGTAISNIWNGIDYAASAAGIGYGDRAQGKGVFSTFLDSLFGKSAGSGASVKVDNTEAQEKLEETKSTLEEIDNTEAEAIATVDPTGAVEGAAAANDAISGIVKSVTTDVWVKIHYSGGGGGKHGGSGMEREGDDSLIGMRATGDKDFHGGPVLVNDQPGGWNPELIVANGRAFIANGGDPAVLNLPRGAVIYNADETRDIFNGGSDLLNIPSFADGTDYGMLLIETKTKPSGGKKKSSDRGSGSSGSSGGGSSAFSDDMMKKLEQYMADILDAAEDALNDQLEAINAQIYALKYQTEAAEKATALEEARLQLLEAEKNLLDANTERTVRYYNATTGQWEWMADQREVMRAQEELYDAQKNVLEAEYDALATAWSELKDEITKALENKEEIDINAILEALGKSAASGSLPSLRTLIGDIGTYTDDPRAVANFDGGGLARGVGWMPKGTRGTEAVLNSTLTKAILNPQTNAAFQGFTDSLSTLFQMAGGNGGLPSSRFMGNVSNLYGGNTYIEGVKIGSDMLNRPLSEVLSTLNLYKNN